MPYGYVLLSPTPSPDASGIVPFVCRLSPRQPGYVMTVCEATRVERRVRHIVMTGERVDNIFMMGTGGSVNGEQVARITSRTCSKRSVRGGRVVDDEVFWLEMGVCRGG